MKKNTTKKSIAKSIETKTVKSNEFVLTDSLLKNAIEKINWAEMPKTSIEKTSIVQKFAGRLTGKNDFSCIYSGTVAGLELQFCKLDKKCYSINGIPLTPNWQKSFNGLNMALNETLPKIETKK